MKTDKKILWILLALLLAAIVYSYRFVPHSFYLGGGSCYQGITASIDQLVVEICGVLGLLSLILILIKTESTAAKILSVLSVAIWILWAVVANLDAESEFLYFMPLLMINISIIFVSFKSAKIPHEVPN